MHVIHYESNIEHSDRAGEYSITFISLSQILYWENDISIVSQCEDNQQILMNRTIIN